MKDNKYVRVGYGVANLCMDWTPNPEWIVEGKTNNHMKKNVIADLGEKPRVLKSKIVPLFALKKHLSKKEK